VLTAFLGTSQRTITLRIVDLVSWVLLPAANLLYRRYHNRYAGFWSSKGTEGLAS
jgi:hypothetical protein